MIRVCLAVFLVGCSASGGKPAGPIAPGPALPLDTSFGLAFVTVPVNGGAPLTFLIDTGFDVSILDTDTAARLGVAVAPAERVAQPGGEVEMSKVPELAFGFGRLTLRTASAKTLGIGTATTALLGRRIDGIIGHDILAQAVFTLDYPHKTLTVEAADEHRPPAAGRPIPVEVVGAEPFVEATLVLHGGREVKGRFKVDTGSLDVAGLNKNFATERGVLAAAERTVSLAGVGAGGETEGVLLRVDELGLGGFRFRRPVIGVTLDSKGFENRADAGTLGGALLSRFAIVLDYAHRRMFLVPGAAIDQPIAEDGAGLAFVADGQRLIVRAVIAGSAAERAGIHAGDELVTFDDLTAVPPVLPRLWELVHGPAGARHHLTLRRDGATLEVTLALASYL
jgi:hypothetical protein